MLLQKKPTLEQFELVTSTTSYSHAPSQSNDIAGWPRGPRKLPRWRVISLWIDLLCIALVVPFYILIYFCCIYHGKSVNRRDWGRIQLSAGLSATIYPLLFSAVVGRMTRRVAAWRLERGSSVHTLELINGSSTLIRTIATYLSLQSFSILGIFLILLWAMSPVGGQSPLHVISTQPVIDSSLIPLQYLNTSSSGQGIFGYADDADEVSALDAVYVTSLLAPSSVQSSSMDVWGNVKIPLLRTLPDATNSTGWVKANSSNEATVYSSLVGIPIMGLDHTGNVSFALNSTYFDLTSDPSMSDAIFSLDGTGFTVQYVADADDASSPAQDAAAGHIYLHSNDGYTISLQMNQIHLQSTVNCTVNQGYSCWVTAMRQINTPSVAYDSAQWNLVSMANLLLKFNLTATGSDFPLTEAYLRSPNTGLATNLSDPATASPSMDDIAIRMTQMFNTFAFSSLDAAGILQGSTQYATNATAHLEHSAVPIYVVDWLWLGIFAVAVTVLGICALVMISLGMLSLNSDVLGFVSTATLHSPFIPVPDRGTTLSGEERARLMKNMVIRLGDVQNHDQVAGRLGFGIVDSVVRSQKGRHYQ